MIDIKKYQEALDNLVLYIGTTEGTSVYSIHSEEFKIDDSIYTIQELIDIFKEMKCEEIKI